MHEKLYPGVPIPEASTDIHLSTIPTSILICSLISQVSSAERPKETRQHASKVLHGLMLQIFKCGEVKLKFQQGEQLLEFPIDYETQLSRKVVLDNWAAKPKLMEAWINDVQDLSYI